MQVDPQYPGGQVSLLWLTMFIIGYSTMEPTPEPPQAVEPLMPWWGPFLVWIVYGLVVAFLELRPGHNGVKGSHRRGIDQHREKVYLNQFLLFYYCFSGTRAVRP